MKTEGRTDMTKLIVAFRNFAKAPKMQLHTKTRSSMPFGAIIAVYFEDYT